MRQWHRFFLCPLYACVALLPARSSDTPLFTGLAEPHTPSSNALAPVLCFALPSPPSHHNDPFTRTEHSLKRVVVKSTRAAVQSAIKLSREPNFNSAVFVYRVALLLTHYASKIISLKSHLRIAYSGQLRPFPGISSYSRDLLARDSPTFPVQPIPQASKYKICTHSFPYVLLRI